jgi:hypothetical protein
MIMGNPFGTPDTQAKTSAPSPAGGDPFATVPDAPLFEGINQSDAKAGAVAILKINSVEQVRSKYPKPGTTDEYPMQDRLSVDAILVNSVNGKEPGTKFEDMHIYWVTVAAQFKDRVGDGKLYLVKFGAVGNAITATEVTDPAVRAAAAKFL